MQTVERPATSVTAARPEPVEGPPAGVHPAEYLAVLARHRWLALGAFLAVIVPALLWTLLQTPIYQATTRVMLGDETSPVPVIGQRAESQKSAEDGKAYLETQYELLQSRALAKRVIHDLKLAENQAYLAPVPLPFSWRAIAARFSAPAASPASTRADDPALQEASASVTAAPEPPAWIVDRFLSDLIVSPLVDSRLVDVMYESPDPVLAARIANAVARQFIEQDLESRFLATQDAAKWLDARLQEQRDKVSESDQRLQQYKERQDALSVEDRQNIVVQRLGDLNSAVTRAKTERIQREQTWNQLAAAQGNRQALESAPPIIQNTFLLSLKTEIAELQRQKAQLTERYGERHPEMQRVNNALANAQTRFDVELDKVVSAVKADYDTALAQERSLSGALEQQKNEALSLNRKNLEYGTLEREAISNRQVYEAVLQQTKQTGLASEFKQSNIRVVDRAETPAIPARPDKVRSAVLSVLAATLLALGLVFGREFLDRHIKTPDDLRVGLKLACLGMLTKIEDPAVAAQAILDRPGVPAGFSEAFRGIRNGVWLGTPVTKGGSLLVTSSASQDGKSIVALNLAASMAAAGDRVLLIDADMRRPRQHTVLGKPREPGLSGVLAGRTPLAGAIVETDVAKLSFLAAGPQPPNPTELLDRNRFRLLLDSLGAAFDWVIVDSAPVMAVADAEVMARDVSGVVFVARAGQTRRDVAQEAVRRLRTARATLVGGILNGVDLKGQTAYYSRYYNPDYEKYYVARD